MRRLAAVVASGLVITALSAVPADAASRKFGFVNATSHTVTTSKGKVKSGHGRDGYIRNSTITIGSHRFRLVDIAGRRSPCLPKHTTYRFGKAYERPALRVWIAEPC